MNASKSNRKSLERLLYIATVLVILVILSVIIWVIPHVVHDTAHEKQPAMAGLVFWVLISIHVILLGVLIRNIRISLRGGRMRKTGLIITGIVLIMMSMFLIDAAGVYLEHKPDMYSVVVVLFNSAFCDITSAVITIMLPVRLPDL